MFCTSCGNKLVDGSKFCNSCGATIGVNQKINDNKKEDLENKPKDSFIPLDTMISNKEEPQSLFMENDLKLASFGVRLGAFLIDVIILTFFTMIILSLLPQIESMQFFPIFLLIIYFTFFESSSSHATFGKKAMGIYVMTENGDTLTTGKVLIRNISRLLSGIFLIGYLMAIFTKKTQTLHDKIASTLVVKK